MVGDRKQCDQLDEATTATLQPIFAEYYRRVHSILEIMQSVIDRDGRRREVNVTADLAALQIRRKVAQMVAEENGTRTWRARASTLPPTSAG